MQCIHNRMERHDHQKAISTITSDLFYLFVEEALLNFGSTSSKTVCSLKFIIRILTEEPNVVITRD